MLTCATKLSLVLAADVTQRGGGLGNPSSSIPLVCADNATSCAPESLVIVISSGSVCGAPVGMILAATALFISPVGIALAPMAFPFALAGMSAVSSSFFVRVIFFKPGNAIAVPLGELSACGK